MNRESGNRQWLDDYLSLKQVKPDNPYSVPEDYFEDLSEKIRARVRLEELKNSDPTGGFTVPADYFTGLSEMIQGQVTLAEASNPEHPGFAVPEGYFAALEEQIKSRVLVEEALSGPAGFEVPAGYFDKLSADIVIKTTASATPQGTAIVRRLFSSTAMQYATAACLVLAVGATLLLNRQADPATAHKHSFLHKSLSAIPVGDIQNYLQSHLDASDTRTLIDESKHVDAENLSHDLQDALDSTSQ